MTNDVQLLGGCLAVDDGKSNSLRNLSATTNGTLTVGTGGLLSFASFTPGANLAARSITIDAPLTGNILKFNSDISSSKSYFRWKDGDERYPVRQDADGYLHPVRGGSISIR